MEAKAKVGKLKLECVNSTKTVGKHGDKQLATIRAILTKFFINFFVSVNKPVSDL